MKLSEYIDIYNRDNMEAMKEFPDKYFDLAIVDPPYGIGIDGQKQSINKNPKHNRKEHKKKGWDNEPPSVEYFRELERVSKHQIIWGANYFLYAINKCTKGWVVWYKGQEGLTMSDAELAYSSFDQATRVCRINRVELLKDGTIHPTQKPILLYRWLLKNYAKEGDKILDTHLGSGSIAIACHDYKFHLTGFEIDEEYFNASVQRIQQHVRQQVLF